MSDTLLYVAIDFGTAYSGYCVKSNAPGKGSQFRDTEWGAEYGIRSCKTPTCIMFDSDGHFQCFGYAAMKKYTNKASLQGNEYFFSNFKMELYKNTAGLVTESKPERLMLALEPEAASVYCKQLPTDGFVGGEEETMRLDQSSGTQYIVADCGGGTIDITVHEVIDAKKVKEVYKVSGNDLGGQNIDRELKSFLQQIFGDECWKDYEKNHAPELQKFMFDFASAKCADENEGISFPCSYNLTEIVKKHRGEDIASLFQGINGATWNDGSIDIEPAKFRSFFDESFRGIAKILKEIMKRAELHIEYLLLVGGYASSKILQDYIKGQFGRKCKVMCPLHPQEAVMVGAVEFGMQPEVVMSRICGLTYAIAVGQRFDESKHKTEKKFFSSDGVAYCDDRFERLVKREESVGYNETKSHIYNAINFDQESMIFRFFSTTRLSAEYVDEWGIDQIGSMTVPMPIISGGTNRQVRLDVRFGSTEITATATDLTSDETDTVIINFMRK
ncbi:heat shock 70 kDa protein 12A-like isoform X2 [Sardina pilchardus]|uniref:heat shock 70 kDa protein 12A-like isoform X2 n=1 Tax=Sardina pilchardus TaxID=27697 RepID=UPI002E11BE10